LALHERHRLTTVGMEDVLGFPCLYAVEGRSHRTTCVHPESREEASAKVPSRVFLPSALTTSPPPPCNAERHACSLATMPLFAVPALTRRAASRVVSRSIVCP